MSVQSPIFQIHDSKSPIFTPCILKGGKQIHVIVPLKPEMYIMEQESN
jgi:hypothetical protein